MIPHQLPKKYTEVGHQDIILRIMLVILSAFKKKTTKKIIDPFLSFFWIKFKSSGLSPGFFVLFFSPSPIKSTSFTQGWSCVKIRSISVQVVGFTRNIIKRNESSGLKIVNKKCTKVPNKNRVSELQGLLPSARLLRLVKAPKVGNLPKFYFCSPLLCHPEN